MLKSYPASAAAQTWANSEWTLTFQSDAKPEQIEAAIRAACVPASAAPVPEVPRPWWWWLAMGAGTAWLLTASWVIYRTASGWPVL